MSSNRLRTMAFSSLLTLNAKGPSSAGPVFSGLSARGEGIKIAKFASVEEYVIPGNRVVCSLGMFDPDTVFVSTVGMPSEVHLFSRGIGFYDVYRFDKHCSGTFPAEGFFCAQFADSPRILCMGKDFSILETIDLRDAFPDAKAITPQTIGFGEGHLLFRVTVDGDDRILVRNPQKRFIVMPFLAGVQLQHAIVYNERVHVLSINPRAVIIYDISGSLPVMLRMDPLPNEYIWIASHSGGRILSGPRGFLLLADEGHGSLMLSNGELDRVLPQRKNIRTAFEPAPSKGTAWITERSNRLFYTSILVKQEKV